MKKFLISILILFLFSTANAEIILSPEEVEDENLFEYIEEELETDKAEIVSSDSILITEIVEFSNKSIAIDYTFDSKSITIYAILTGFENTNYTLQWESSDDGITFIPIPNETNETITLEINEIVNYPYIRATATLDIN